MERYWIDPHLNIMEGAYPIGITHAADEDCTIPDPRMDRLLARTNLCDEMLAVLRKLANSNQHGGSTTRELAELRDDARYILTKAHKLELTEGEPDDGNST